MKKFIFSKCFTKLTTSKRPTLVYLFLYLGGLPMSSYADTDVASILTNFLGLLTGTWGTAVATIAIVGLGYLCFVMGKVPKSVLIAVVFGVGFIFGAHSLLTHLQNG